jgi:hypothetical protein
VNRPEPTPDEQAAAAAALDDTTLGVSTPTGAEPGEGTVQVLVRVPARSRDRWKAAAEAAGTTLSDFVRQCCDERAAESLDCQHPLMYRKSYPWTEICTACGVRLWDNDAAPTRGPGRL